MPNESTSYQNLLETIKTIVAVPNKLTTLRTAETKALKQCEQKSQENIRAIDVRVEELDDQLRRYLSQARQVVEKVGLKELVSSDLPEVTNRNMSSQPQATLQSLEHAANSWYQNKNHINDSKLEAERRRIAEEEAKFRATARQQSILGGVVQFVILLSSFLLAQYLQKNEGGDWYLLAAATGIILGGLFGRPVSVFVHITCEWSGTTRAKPSRLAGFISACGLGLMGTGIGAVFLKSDYSTAAYAVGIGAFLMVVAFDVLPVVRMKDEQNQILAPHLWDGWSGLAIGVFLFVPALITSKTSNDNTFVWVSIGAMILAAAVRPVGLMARKLFGVVVRRALEYGSTFGVNKIRPGAVFWAWLDYESVDQYGDSGKQRPVMVVSLNGPNLQALAFTTKDKTYRDDVITLGRGSWDRQGRDSFVKLSTLHTFEQKKIARIAGQVDRQRFEMVIKEASRFHPSLLRKKKDGLSTIFSNGLMNSLGLGLLWLVIAILLGEI
jgi:hypothetical protein